MTHEAIPDSEAPGGPETDPNLPDATSVPTSDYPDELAPVDDPEIDDPELAAAPDGGPR
jgi:hypothetical protein